MTQHGHDDLWRDFPKTAMIRAGFATEANCRAYRIAAQRRDGALRHRAAPPFRSRPARPSSAVAPCKELVLAFGHNRHTT